MFSTIAAFSQRNKWYNFWLLIFTIFADVFLLSKLYAVVTVLLILLWLLVAAGFHLKMSFTLVLCFSVFALMIIAAVFQMNTYAEKLAIYTYILLCNAFVLQFVGQWRDKL